MVIFLQVLPLAEPIVRSLKLEHERVNTENVYFFRNGRLTYLPLNTSGDTIALLNMEFLIFKEWMHEVLTFKAYY